MIRTNTLAHLLLIIIFFSSLGGCSTLMNNNSRSAQAYKASNHITATIKAQLAKQLRLYNTHVSTYNGVVQLSGYVKNKQQLHAAIAIAKAVPGVKSVANSLLIRK